MIVIRRAVHDDVAPPSAVSRRAVAVALGFAVVGVCALSIFAAFFVFHAHHGAWRFVARVAPIPAAVVDGRVVWYHEVVERANALEKIDGVPPDVSMARALLRTERRAILLTLADRLDISITNDEIDGATEVWSDLAVLETVAGWTSRDVARYGVAAYMLAERVETAALADASLQATARARIERVQLKYEQGIGFADLALEYGEGDAAPSAGDIGFVDPATLPEELKTVASTIAAGDVSGIVETPFAFWMVKAEEVIENGSSTALGTFGGTRSVWLRVIEVKKDLLGDVIDEQLRTARVRVFLW